MNKDQLIQKIASKKDDRDYRLLVDLNGGFKLIDLDFWNENMNYVMKIGTFDVGNDYVGINASKDIRFIDDLYETGLKAWNEHKRTGAIIIINYNS
ncbi:hypothetical protein ACRTAH_002493 [Clostridium perfringens]